MRSDRNGSLLAAVLVAALVAGLLGMAAIQRSIRSLSTAGWSRDHLALRLLAESAVEEVHLSIARASNEPGEPPFTELRLIPQGDSFAPVPLTAGAPSEAGAVRAELERELGGRITLGCTAVRRKLVPVSTDPLERAGVVSCEAIARLTTGRATVTERVRLERAFRIARVTPPRPLDQIGLFVGLPAGRLFRGIRKGTPVFAAAGGGPQTLVDLATSDALKAVPSAAMPDVTRAINQLSPGALSARAHYVTTCAAELGRFLAGRLDRDRSLNGLVHNLSQEEIQLSLPRFRGKCLISTCGPVRVGEIRLDDPSRDSLTIVARGRIIVTGRQVEAVLVNFSDLKEGVVFGTRALVRGGVLASRFPVGLSLSGLELEQCAIEHPAILDSGDAASAQPDPGLLSRYVVAFSPHPVALEHARDGGEWSSW